MADVPVVWLDTGESAKSESRAAIDAWARSRGVRLVGFASDQRSALPYPEAVVLRVEQEIVRARDAISALDADAADAALGRAETELVAHPEVPQSAWLLAEILRARAARAKGVAPKDEARANSALREAHGLDLGRAAGIGEPESAETDEGPVDVAVEGDDDGELRVDGRPRGPERGLLHLAPGRHHVTLVVDGRPVWAAWTFAARGAKIVVPSQRVPCSREDLAIVELRGASVVAPRARCDDWVTARRSPSSLMLARCHGDACGPLVEWRIRLPEAPLVPRYEDRRVPMWAKVTGVAAVVVLVAGVALVGSGAFETPTETTRFSYSGVVPR